MKSMDKAGKKKVLLVLAIIVCLWILIGVIDFTRVHSFERPIFCVWSLKYLDGGSGTYVGLGYSFEIKGNFFPDDELPGVTKYIAKIFDVPVMTGVRD